jgi:hypothetical protein
VQQNIPPGSQSPCNLQPATCNEITTTLKIILLSTILLLSISLHSGAQQTFRWGVQAGSEKSDAINDIVVLGDDIYVTGRFSGQFASGNETIKGEGMTDMYLLKLDENGNTVWLRTLAGEGANNLSRIAMQDKNIFTGGTVSGNVSSGKQKFNGDGTSIFVSSWNEKGKINWLTRLPYSGHATLDVLEPGPDGSLLAGGLLHGTITAGENELESSNAKRAWSVMFSPEGIPLRNGLSSGEGNHRLISATFGNEQELIQLFSVSDNFCWNQDTMLVFPNSMKNGLVLTKTSLNGDLQWIKTFTGTGYAEGVNVISGRNGEVVLCAGFNNEIMCSDTLLSTESQLETALFLFSSSGQMQWAKTISSPVKARAMDMLITRHGNILVAGYFRGTYSLGENQFFSNDPGGEIFLLQLDVKGNLVWHDEPGRDASAFGKAIALDKAGNIIFAGGFKGELALKDSKLKAVGKEDILVAKYFNCLQKEAEITGDLSLCPGGVTELTVSGDFNSYLWNNNDWSGNSIIIDKPGEYTVTAFDRQGCAASDTVTVVTAGTPGLGLPDELELWPGDKVWLTANSGFLYYSWDDGTQTHEREVSYLPETDSVILSVSAETYQGCVVTDSVTVRFRHQKNRTEVFYPNAEAWPNPVREKLAWFFRTEKPADLNVMLTDSKSVVVYNQQFKGYIPYSVKNIDMSRLASGSYVLNIRAGDVIFNQVIIKE